MAIDPLWLALAVLAGAALAAAAVIAHVGYWSRRLNHPLHYASVERLATSDGSAFDLRRIDDPGEAGDAGGEPPILIVHGLAANHRNDDLDEQASLARHLARSGRDVWLITLRSGRSDRSAAESRLATFSAMAKHDVPDAVAAVLQRTGASQLDYIGFSMGGMLAYASLGRFVPLQTVRRVVLIGAPGRVRIPLPLLHRLRGLPSWLAPPSPFRFLARLYAFAVEAFTTPFHRIPINPDNVARGVLRRTMVNMIEDVPWMLTRELGTWAMSDGQIRVDGIAAMDGVAGLPYPVRFFAGAADHVAPEGSVRCAFDAWGGADKEFVVLSRQAGHNADYGHGDLAIGVRADVDIFEPIRTFLAAEKP